MHTKHDAILLFCHGARASSWREPFDDLLGRVRSTSAPIPVQLGFLEFMEPNFATAVDALYANGARRIQLVLLFLAAGGHTRRDVTALVDQALALHSDLEITVSPTMLESEAFRAATAQWIAQTVATPRGTPL